MRSMSIWNKYNVLLHKRPILTKSATSGTLMAISDIICQKITRTEGENLNFKRTLILASFSTVMGGAALHFWYKVLDRLIPSKGFSSSIRKLAIDQLVFAPVGLVTFFSYTSYMEGETKEMIKRNVEENFPAALKLNYSIWPFVNIINFQFVPADHRVLYIASISLVWNAYLSYMKHRNKSHVDVKKMAQI